MWMLDIAREQTPTLDHLYQYASFSLDAGYDTLGLYLEHRFAYPSAPWAHGKGRITPEMISSLRSEFPSLQIVPFINLLGHMEGFLNSEQGTGFRETPFRGMQGCPNNPEFVIFCENLLDDTMAAFDSELIHIGGDETWELAKCPLCNSNGNLAVIYADHFTPLIQRVIAKGRRPAIWGDMFLEHPSALVTIPKETLIFDWQYHYGLTESTPKLQKHGHETVGCPTLHVFDAAWMHVEESETNVREVCRDATGGICLTTWESGLFGAYDTVLPAVKWARKVMDDPLTSASLIEEYGKESEWAQLMGIELNKLGGVFDFDGHRNRLKCRLLLYSNPFLAWKYHAEQLASLDGTRALEICEKAIHATHDEGQKGVAMFVRGAVEFVRMAEASHLWYAQNEPERAIKALAPSRQAFETLENLAKRTHTRIGGSLADIERCRIAREHVERVITRIQKYGRGELGYQPSFDTLTHTRFVPHDQSCWWGVNKWGEE